MARTSVLPLFLLAHCVVAAASLVFRPSGTAAASLVGSACRRGTHACMCQPCLRAGKDELNQALARFGEAAERDPRNVSAHRNLGLVAKRLRHLALAAASFRRALMLLPHDVDLKYHAGQTLAEMGHIDAAEKLFAGLASDEARSPPQQPWAHPPAKLLLANLVLNGRGQRERAFRLLCEYCETTSRSTHIRLEVHTHTARGAEAPCM